MAKEINLEKKQKFTNQQDDNVLYRNHLEYTGSKLFWGAALGLSAITIYASLTYLVIKQLKKD